VVEVQLKRVGTGVLDEPRVPDPAAGTRRVEAGDDRDGSPGLDPCDGGDISVGGADEPIDRREVVERLGEVLGALLQRPVELELLGHDLFFEQRREDDRADARGLQSRGHRRLSVLGRGRGDNGRAEFEP
jgi:hypothetical protein